MIKTRFELDQADVKCADERIQPLHEFDDPRGLRNLRNSTADVPTEFRLDSSPNDV